MTPQSVFFHQDVVFETITPCRQECLQRCSKKKKERKWIVKVKFWQKTFFSSRKPHSVTPLSRPICSLVWCHPTTRHQPTLQWCWWLPRVLQEVHSHPSHRPPSTPFLFPPRHISPTWHIHRVRLFYWMAPLWGRGQDDVDHLYTFRHWRLVRPFGGSFQAKHLCYC